MKKIDLGQAVTILANLGVVAGIVFLAVELQQNRELTRAQIRHDVAQADVEMILKEDYDLDTADLVLRGHAGEPLTDAETFKFQGLHTAWFRIIENVHYQYRIGLFDDAEFRSQLAIWRVRFEQPATREHWCRSRFLYSEVLVEELERLEIVSC